MSWNGPTGQAIRASLVAATLLAICPLDTAFAELVLQRSATGRFVAFAMTEVTRAWKSQHPLDENFIYLLDSATGRIQICSDMEGLCRSIPGSERTSKGNLLGRFAGLKVAPATGAWKSKYPSDEQLIYTLDSTTGQIQICGNVEGVCTLVSSVHAREPVKWPKGRHAVSPSGFSRRCWPRVRPACRTLRRRCGFHGHLQDFLLRPIGASG